MGQILSQPVTEKTSEEGKDERLTYGLSSMQGWRISMEDSHATVLDLQQVGGGKNVSTDDKISFFGVYDGHGGDRVALFTGENLHNIVAKQPTFSRQDYAQALKDGFLSTDRAILQDEGLKNEQSGCTATSTLVSNSKIFCANAGDSRTVLGVKGIAKALSYDHKPQNEGERARICAAGGFVEAQRVNGNLALSRAIGDFEFKKSANLPPEEQVVTAFPDVMEHDITPDDEFIILACDGIWDCMHSQTTVEFVRRGIAARQSLVTICENLMNNCLAPKSDMSGIGCDNMTVMIVGLLQGKSEEEWYDMIGKRVQEGDGPVAPESSAEMKSCDFEEEQAQQQAAAPSMPGTITLEQLLGHTNSIVRGNNGQYIIQADDAAQLLSQVGYSPETAELANADEDAALADEQEKITEYSDDDEHAEEPEGKVESADSK